MASRDTSRPAPPTGGTTSVISWRRTGLRGCIALILILTGSPAFACSCASLDMVIENLQSGAWTLKPGESLFHARVTALTGEREAEVEVLETFAGQVPKTIRLTASSAATCTIAFRLGQQHIFYPGRDRAISLCNQYDVTPESLTRLRELRRSLAGSPQRQAGSRMR